jgi:hypothetical protein
MPKGDAVMITDQVQSEWGFTFADMGPKQVIEEPINTSAVHPLLGPLGGGF